MRLQKNEMVLVLQGLTRNRYKIIKGPKILLPALKPTERVKIYLGYQLAQASVTYARTRENISITTEIEVGFRVNPKWINDDNYVIIPKWSGGGWNTIVAKRTEYIWRKLVADQSWKGLAMNHNRLEQHLKASLSHLMKWLAVEVLDIRIIWMRLPEELHQSIVRAERDKQKALSRAETLREYAQTVGLPYDIDRWEWLDMLRDKEALPPVLLPPHLSSNGAVPANGASEPIYETVFPTPQTNGAKSHQKSYS